MKKSFGFSPALTPAQRGLLIGVASAGAAILLQACVDSNLHEPAIALLLALCAGIGLSIGRIAGATGGGMHVLLIRSRLVAFVLSFVVIGGLTVGALALGRAWIHYEEGLRAAARDDFPLAIQLYEKAIALDRGKAMYHRSVAAAYFQIFQRESQPQAMQSALKELEIAVSLNPLDGRAYERLGFVCTFLASSQINEKSRVMIRPQQRAAWLQSARTAYLRALEIEPFSAFHRLELARLNMALGDVQGAIGFAQESLIFEPNFLPGRVWLAHLYAKRQQPEAAAREYREIVDRYRRYAAWGKNPLEEQFLTVDLPALQAVLMTAGINI
jgi:tetratricopeptide (TPR) repeat protein